MFQAFDWLGIANAVGLAIASKHLGAMFNKNSYPVINNFIYAIVGDGCLQEGVALEAISLAGYYKSLLFYHLIDRHLGLGNLVVLYDDNRIQIDGSTELAFSENVLDRMKACGWHTQEILDGDTNLTAIASAIEAAKKETSKPSIIKIKTLIGFGSKHQGTEKVI